MHNFLMVKKNSTENGLFKQLNNTGVPFATNCILNGLSIYIHMFSLPFFCPWYFFSYQVYKNYIIKSHQMGKYKINLTSRFSLEIKSMFFFYCPKEVIET